MNEPWFMVQVPLPVRPLDVQEVPRSWAPASTSMGSDATASVVAARAAGSGVKAGAVRGRTRRTAPESPFPGVR